MKHKTDSTTAGRVHQVQITFTDKQLTAWGGMCALVGKFLERIHFKEWVEMHVPVEEKSPNAKGKYEKVLALLLTSITGGTRFSHVTWWSHGMEGVKACFGVNWLPQTASVLTRFFGKFTQGHNESLLAASAELTHKLLHEEKLVEDDLIFDSTVCTRYGEQEGSKKGYNPSKHGRASHHPLKAGLGIGYVVNLWNRSGDCHTAHQCIQFYDQTRLGLAGKINLRRVLADSGFSEEPFLEHLEQSKQPYIIALRLTKFVLQAICRISAWKKIDEGIEVAEAEVTLSTWNKSRRISVVRQHIPTRPKATGKQPMLFREMEEHRNYRYAVMVTNDNELAPEMVWRTYRPRANEENCIKELKNGYGWDEFNIHSFWGTEAVMILIGMVCYNLVHYLNRQVLKTKEEAVVRLKTLRLRTLAIPAFYGTGGRCPTLRLGVQNKSLRSKIRYWLTKIHRLTLLLFNCNAVGPTAQTI